MFSSLKLANTLIRRGMPREQAEALAEGIAEGMTEQVATKQDLEMMSSQIKVEMSQLRVELKEDISQLRVGLKEDIGQLRADLKERETSMTRWGIVLVAPLYGSALAALIAVLVKLLRHS